MTARLWPVTAPRSALGVEVHVPTLLQMFIIAGKGKACWLRPSSVIAIVSIFSDCQSLNGNVNDVCVVSPLELLFEDRTQSLDEALGDDNGEQVGRAVFRLSGRRLRRS